MFLEWNDCVAPVDGASYRLFVKQIHDRITTVGSGVTHLADKDGQFDFINDVIPPNRSSTGGYKIGKEYTSKPLYYKFECDGFATVFISIAIANLAYNATYPKYHVSIVNISQRFELFNPYANHITPINNNNQNAATSDYLSCGDSLSVYLNPTSEIFGNGGLLYTNNDGVLIFGFGLGTCSSGSSIDAYVFPPVFIFIKSYTKGFIFHRPRQIGGIFNPNRNAVSPIQKDKFSTDSIGCLNSNGQIHSIYNMINDSENSYEFIPYYTISYDGGISVIDSIFTYSKRAISETGIIDVGGRKMYLLGNLIQTWNIGGYDNTSFAIEVTNDI